MNRQELSTSIASVAIPNLFKPKRPALIDVTSPRLFSGWPYFILVLAALFVGNAKIHQWQKGIRSQGKVTLSMASPTASSQIAATAKMREWHQR